MTMSVGTSTTNDPQVLFECIARTTWEWLREARQRKLSFSEETITDIAALQIATAASTQVRIAKATRQEEHQHGIDWMWFIGNSSQGYSQYAVQAKKIMLGSSTDLSYRLRHRVSRTPGSEFQIQRLKEFARRTGATPLYGFYNNVDSTLATTYWHCRVYPDIPDDIRQMGCTVVPLDAIRLVHKRNHSKSFSAVHKDGRSIPWRCLFHSPCLAACLKDTPVYGQGALANKPPEDDYNSLPRGESLPEFLLQDAPVVEIADVIQQLYLPGQPDDVDSEAGATSRPPQAIPKWFVVMDSEPTQLTQT